MPPAKKLIEVALPLDAINRASAREKSIRHGHPSTLHLWWARRPLAAARAVIFTSLVDDPDDPNANLAFVAACNALPGDGDNVKAKGDSPRMRLFDFIERLVTWEATTDEKIMSQARELINVATNGNPPPLLDPFAGGGSIPLEAQRLGLEAHASDLNPVAVMINKAMIEIPPRFADKPPVNPRDRADVLGTPHPPAPSPTRREGEFGAYEKWDVSPELEKRMRAVARDLRKNPTAAEERLWQAIRKKQILGRKFRRQMPIGAFVVDFYCPSERLVVEVDGGIHNNQQEADRLRQELIESLGIHFLRLTNEEIMRDLPGAIAKIQQSFSDFAQGEKSPSPPVGEGFGVGGDSTWKGAAGLAADVRYYGEWMRDRAFERIGHLYPKHNGETVIAWLWARTVISPNPAVNAPVPLVRSFVLSKKKGRECWAKPIVEGKSIRFEVTEGLPPKGQDGTMIRKQGAKCIISGEPMSFDYIREEARADRLDSMLMAIVTDGKHGRSYYSPTDEHLLAAESAEPEWKPFGKLVEGKHRSISAQLWGMDEFHKLFTVRQLTALTTFSDLVHEARELATQDALAAMRPHPPAPSPKMGEGEKTPEKWDVSPALRMAMKEVARGLRKNATQAEDRLWQAIRGKRINGKKFRRQTPIGAFAVDFYCASARLAVEVDGGIHDQQVEADRRRQELIESLGIRFLRLTNDEVMRDLPGAIAKIKQALESPPYPESGPNASEPADDSPSPFMGASDRVPGASEPADDSPSPFVAASDRVTGASEPADDSPSPFMGEGAGGWGLPLREGGAGARAYGEAVSVYLAFAVDKAADYWTAMSTWMPRGTIGHLFARQAIPMNWDYPEANPLSDFHCAWSENYEWVAKSMECLVGPQHGVAIQTDAVNFKSGSAPSLSTDPPYYDNIGYADLSDFFYVWLRRNLREIYPDVFSTMLVPKASELIASRHRHSSKDEAKEYFESGMLDAFSNFRRFVREDLPLTVYYAFKQQDAGFLSANPPPQTPPPQGERGFNASELSSDSPSPFMGARGRGMGGVASTGWETMLASMIKAGFTIVGTWPMRTERSARSNAIRTNALASSIVLVCRPRPADARAISRRRFLQALRAELPAAIAEMRTGKILPVDLAQASIGPGMAIYSRYRAVLEANGEPVSVRAALSLINNVLAETLYEFVGEVDEYTRFAFDWFQQHRFEAGDAGSAETLAMAKNTSLPGLERAGLIELGGGAVRLLHWRDYDPGAYDPSLDKRPTVWEGAHHLIERLNSHGETGAARLLMKMSPELAGAAQDLAFSLYDICDRNGWAAQARDYNGLIASWQGSDGIASEAARLAKSPEQSGMFDA